MDVQWRWSGQVMEPVDSVAFIGRNPGDKNVYVVTGDSGNGMTHGTIAGILLLDLISGRTNPWETIYNPSRVSLRTAGRFAQENINTALQYGDYATAGDVDTPDDIAIDSGAVMRQGLSKIAIYRDTEGKIHQFSAICPHLGGIVRWNKIEKTWDCPCHGSRFDPFGEVLNGPANTPLTSEETSKEFGQPI